MPFFNDNDVHHIPYGLNNEELLQLYVNQGAPLLQAIRCCIEINISVQTRDFVTRRAEYLLPERLWFHRTTTDKRAASLAERRQLKKWYEENWHTTLYLR